MAAVRSLEASSSTSPCIYDVFLNFRGEDTRKSFTDHLYTALDYAGFRTFRDDDGIERGEKIKSELQKAIRESRMSIVILSKNYASSSWCLDELVMILKCKSTSGHEVLPLFYDVDPSLVRKQMGSFEEAFARHEGKIEAESAGRRKEWMSKVEEWRAALREVADFAGMDLQNRADGHESRFIKKIIKVVGDKLSRTIMDIGPYAIGICSRAREIQFWLEDESADVGVAAICGMGGIGKTTIAKFLYNLNFSRFESSSFLANVREISKQQDGLLCLQRQLVSDILKGRKEKISNVDEGIVKIKEALRFKRVLVILDDVDEPDELYAVLGMCDWLFLGSKIIITTRHERLLRPHEVCKVYRIEKLDYDESLELFSLHAFGQSHPVDDFADTSKLVVEHCEGLPLAIKVLGSSLSGQSIGVWRSQLEKLKAIPDRKILAKLKISYDSLQDEHDRSLFLHLACFFVGSDKDFTITIMDECEFYTVVGIQNLIDRCLVTVDGYNKLVIHHLLQEMGREIVRQESPNEPGERSRLCNHKDSFNVLRHNTGTRKIEGLILDTSLLKANMSARTVFGVNRKCSLEEFLDNSLLSNMWNSLKRYRLGVFSQNSLGNPLADSNEIALETNAFAKMENRKFLKLSHVQISGSYENFPKKIRWMCWHGFPFESIPKYFPLEALVALEMPYSSLKHFSAGTKFLELLKILNLSHSHSLARTPDFIVLPNLEKLILEDCTRLVEIHESIGDLARLVLLNLKDCSSLRKLPRSIGLLKSLETLDISGCSNLENWPTEMVNMDSLTVLRAENVTGITQSPITIQNVKAWYSFIWLSPLKPKRNPATSWASSLPRSLVKLHLRGCNLSDDAFPKDLSNLSLLRELDLSNNPIISLPDCIRSLTGLEILCVCSCTRLRSLVVLQDLKNLQFMSCWSLEKIILPEYEIAGFFCGFRKLTSPGEYGILGSSSGSTPMLVEFSGRYKLEPLGDVDKEIIDNLGLFDLGSMRNLKVRLAFPFSYRKRFSLQGCHEEHVFSTYLPGSKVPGWFNLIDKGSSLSFTAQHRNSRIRCLSLCVVYAFSCDYDRLHPYDRLFLNNVITNTTKRLIWSHCPHVIGIPEANEDMIWLSYWKFENQVEGGDEMNISVFARKGFQVKEVGVRLLYDVEKVEKITQEIPSTSEEVSEQIFRYGVAVPGNSSSYQENTQVYAVGRDIVDIAKTLRCGFLVDSLPSSIIPLVIRTLSSIAKSAPPDDDEQRVGIRGSCFTTMAE
ncbi:disease resistance protein RPV1-like [Rhododendron vialii]|uniref:disease resistance protein RPV1-like n=1 Tax=Rhododendron vialii TaxID=182163 RepID=UPI00265F6115|nr:disease resistance protein RPV1-like [Rhododendron vialii]